MVFLMKFLGARVFDIAFTKMDSRGFRNILQVCCYPLVRLWREHITGLCLRRNPATQPC